VLCPAVASVGQGSGCPRSAPIDHHRPDEPCHHPGRTERGGMVDGEDHSTDNQEDWSDKAGPGPPCCDGRTDHRDQPTQRTHQTHAGQHRRGQRIGYRIRCLTDLIASG
jgi:hypothetical protein